MLCGWPACMNRMRTLFWFFMVLMFSWKLMVFWSSLDQIPEFSLVNCNIAGLETFRNLIHLLIKQVKTLGACKGFWYFWNWGLLMIRLRWRWMLWQRKWMFFLFQFNFPYSSWIESSSLLWLQSIYKINETFKSPKQKEGRNLSLCKCKQAFNCTKPTWTERKSLLGF